MTRPATKGEKIHAAAVVRGAPATLVLLFLFMSAGPSLAHHVMGGALPSTLWEGTLSGLAHLSSELITSHSCSLLRFWLFDSSLHI